MIYQDGKVIIFLQSYTHFPFLERNLREYACPIISGWWFFYKLMTIVELCSRTKGDSNCNTLKAYLPRTTLASWQKDVHIDILNPGAFYNIFLTQCHCRANSLLECISHIITLYTLEFSYNSKGVHFLWTASAVRQRATCGAIITMFEPLMYS